MWPLLWVQEVHMIRGRHQVVHAVCSCRLGVGGQRGWFAGPEATPAPRGVQKDSLGCLSLDRAVQGMRRAGLHAEMRSCRRVAA